MRRAALVGVLATAAVGVAVQNFLYFRASPEAASAGEDPSEATQPTETSVPERVSIAGVRAWVASLPVSPLPRSPFLTRDEAERLAPLARPPHPLGDSESVLPVLAGTLWSRDRRVAWLDGFPLREGERTREFHLERVDRGSVVLRGVEEAFRVDVAAEARTARGDAEGTGAAE